MARSFFLRFFFVAKATLDADSVGDKIGTLLIARILGVFALAEFGPRGELQ